MASYLHTLTKSWPAIYLHTLTQLLVAVVMFVILDSCHGVITGDVSMDNCPLMQLLECKRGINWGSHYARIYSGQFETTFLCDTKTDGGGWIVIQRKIFQDIRFNQKWHEYKYGFGPVCGDYWLGNEYMHKISSSGKYELLIDMMYHSKPYWARYQHFTLDGEQQNYRLHISGFSGTVRDDFTFHSGLSFSTVDRNNDPNNKTSNCGVFFGYGWWYNHCHTVNLNGNSQLSKYWGKGIFWKSITGYYDTLTAVEMKIRKRAD